MGYSTPTSSARTTYPPHPALGSETQAQRSQAPGPCPTAESLKELEGQSQGPHSGLLHQPWPSSWTGQTGSPRREPGEDTALECQGLSPVLGWPWGSCLWGMAVALYWLPLEQLTDDQVSAATDVSQQPWSVTQSTDRVAGVLLAEPEWEVSANSSHSRQNPLGEGWAPSYEMPCWDFPLSRARARIQHHARIEERTGWGPPAMM